MPLNRDFIAVGLIWSVPIDTDLIKYINLVQIKMHIKLHSVF